MVDDLDADSIHAAAVGVAPSVAPSPNQKPITAAQPTPDDDPVARATQDRASLLKEMSRPARNATPAQRAEQQGIWQQELKKHDAIIASGTKSYAPAIDDLSADSIHAAASAGAPPAPATRTAPPANGAPTGRSPISTTAAEFVANQATSLGGTIAGGIAGLGSAAKALWQGRSAGDALSAGADTVAKTQQNLTYQPRSDAGKAAVEGFGSKWNPLNWPAVAGDYAGGKLADAGMPGAGAAVNAVGTVAGGLAMGKAASAAVRSVGKMKVPTEAERIDPTMDRQPAAAAQPTQGTVQPGQPPQGPAGAPGAAQVITPTDSIKAGQTLPTGEAAARAAVLQSVGFDNSRATAVQGDHRARAVEYQMAKFDEPAGQAAAQSFAAERDTMASHVKGLIGDMGGTVGSDQATAYARGKTIVKPIQDLRDWFDGQASKLYAAADEKAQGQPVTLGSFGDALKDESQWTNSDRVHLKGAVAAYAKKAGMQVGEDGTISGNALQSETVRKRLNDERTNANGKYVDAMKDALDNDVTQAAGEQIHEQARALWTLRQDTISDPKGISALLEEDGTNRPVPYEQVADRVSKMPQDQFAHIVKTLRDVPPEVQPTANAALGEIKAHYLNKMLDASTETSATNPRSFWNSAAVRKTMRDNSGRLGTLMTPDELGKVDQLRKAGDILSFDPSYPGAAAQGANAVKQGLMSSLVKRGITAGGTVAGGLVGGPVGAVGGGMAGDLAGGKAAAAIGERQALKKWNKGNVSLSDLMRTGTDR